MWTDIDNDERAFLYVNGRPVQYFGPGRYFVFRPFQKTHVARYSIKTILAELVAEELALVTEGDVAVVDVSQGERAVVRRRGRPVAWLGVGRHVVWTAERVSIGAKRDVAVTVEKLDTSALSAAPLSDDLRTITPVTDYVEVSAPSGAVALRFVDGVLEAVLPAGRHAAWLTTRKVHFSVLDLRERTLAVNGQEVMSRDRVSLRMNIAAVFRITDPVRVATVARDPDELLYLAIQLATRELVGSRTLDELLADREGLATALAPRVSTQAEKVGLLLLELGVKDLVLPGEMRTLLNRVIEAQKEAEANVILRREETAAVRSMANTAKVLSESPMLLRLKELEAYKELAAKVGQVHLVVGDGALDRLRLDIGQGR
ncbi:MAG: slipin family protein [Deltaproteobacteria bacterium]|nr:slipin family protein [Deltaproteobacteria bacterium]